MQGDRPLKNWQSLDPEAELRAALEDPCLEVDELEHLLSEARRKGDDMDPGLIISGCEIACPATRPLLGRRG